VPWTGSTGSIGIFSLEHFQDKNAQTQHPHIAGKKEVSLLPKAI